MIYKNIDTPTNTERMTDYLYRAEKMASLKPKLTFWQRLFRINPELDPRLVKRQNETIKRLQDMKDMEDAHSIPTNNWKWLK